ncbi:hypothetical protein QM480_15105 [Flectobacillus sp. DC10W]|uniref:Uncharacterized protein n=1 Tax=Flectobacillus longus TaxID=2984207 RepID=A0ABT6YQ27_9BACT|nr:hypothetical protein [Flectobacillus longus]MDI9865671.1 hypothetical protein [Flectobacillus longus]
MVQLAMQLDWTWTKKNNRQHGYLPSWGGHNNTQLWKVIRTFVSTDGNLLNIHKQLEISELHQRQ